MNVRGSLQNTNAAQVDCILSVTEVDASKQLKVCLALHKELRNLNKTFELGIEQLFSKILKYLLFFVDTNKRESN